MRMKPTADNMLATACELLKSDILPNVSADKKYEVLMIANAISIVERHLKTGGEIAEKEVEGLRALLSSDEDVLPLNQQLVDVIQSDALDKDPELKDQVYDHLLDTVSAELSVSNPKFLKKMQAK